MGKRDQLIFEHNQIMKELEQLNKKKSWGERDGDRFEFIKKREQEIKKCLKKY